MTLSRVFITVTQKARAVPRLYRVLHDAELYDGKAREEVLRRGVPLPEVFQLLPANHFTKLTREWQWLWKGLNPSMTKLQWRKLAGCHRFGTNNNGFDCSEGKHGPFADFVNGRDTRAALPKIEALVCGGATLRGHEIIERGEPVLLVETLDGNKMPPSVWWVQQRPWLFYEVVSVRPDGVVQSFSITSHKEYAPIVASVEVTFPMSGLVRL